MDDRGLAEPDPALRLTHLYALSQLCGMLQLAILDIGSHTVKGWAKLKATAY